MGRMIVAAVLVAALAATGAAAASSDPDGRYHGAHIGPKGRKLSQSISFVLSRDGRRITRLRTTATTFCVGPTLFDNRIFIVQVYVPRIQIRSNGSFKRVFKPAKGTRFEVRGRRRGRRVSGSIEVRIANCSATDRFVARRVRR